MNGIDGMTWSMQADGRLLDRRMTNKEPRTKQEKGVRSSVYSFEILRFLVLQSAVRVPKRGKGVRHLLCKAPEGPCRQKVPDQLFLPPSRMAV